MRQTKLTIESLGSMSALSPSLAPWWTWRSAASGWRRWWSCCSLRVPLALLAQLETHQGSNIILVLARSQQRSEFSLLFHIIVFSLSFSLRKSNLRWEVRSQERLCCTLQEGLIWSQHSCEMCVFNSILYGLYLYLYYMGDILTGLHNKVESLSFSTNPLLKDRW